jgi:hypothetical protein
MQLLFKAKGSLLKPRFKIYIFNFNFEFFNIHTSHLAWLPMIINHDYHGIKMVPQKYI